jgi:hypothetical protein
MRQAVRTRGSLILALGVVTALGVIPLTAEPVRAAVFPVIVVPKPKPKPRPPVINRPPHNNGGNNGFNGGTPPGGGGGPPPGGQNAPEPATLLTGLLGTSLLGLYAARRKMQLQAAA